MAQGQLARHGLNPYVVAPSALGPGNLLSSIASVWRNTASPYGPLFVSVSHLGASVGGTSLVGPDPGVPGPRAGRRGPRSWCSLPVLARRLGNDPGLALWLAVLSPLALFSFVSSGHNDALMMGLMLAGITLGTGGRLRWGVALCALAATIKLPAAAGIVFLVADALHPCRPVAAVAGHRRVGRHLGAGGGRPSPSGPGSGGRGSGPTALHVPTELRVLITPLVSVGTFVYGVLHAVGLPVTRSATVTVVQARRGGGRRQRHPVDGLPHPGPRRRPPVRSGPDPVRGPQPDAVALVPDVGRGRAGRHLGPAVPGAGRAWPDWACWWWGPVAPRCSTAAPTG